MIDAGRDMTRKIFAYPMLLLVLSACVTINIYFPAAAAEEAARTIVRDVLNTDSEPVPASPPEDKQSAVDEANPALVLIGLVLESWIPAAHAAQADIEINTPGIRAIRASLQRRQSSLAPFYRSGAIGFDSRGSVSLRDPGAVPLRDRNRLNKLLADENSDRAKLYSEIARANGHPEWEAEVRATFARVWIEEAPPGYWYQQGGSWRQR
jgi:uncharacterized protein YdbL (DUF1318 family)